MIVNKHNGNRDNGNRAVYLRQNDSDDANWVKVIYGRTLPIERFLNQTITLEGGLILGDNVHLDNGLRIYTSTGIGQGARIGKDCSIGEWAGHNYSYDTVTIGANAKIGNYCEIGSNVKIGKRVVIGDNCTIDDCSVIGDDSVLSNDISLSTGSIVNNDTILNQCYSASEFGVELNYVGGLRVCCNKLTYPMDFWIDNVEILTALTHPTFHDKNKLKISKKIKEIVTNIRSKV